MSRAALVLLVLLSASCRGRLVSDGEPPAPATSIATPAVNPRFVGSEPFPQRGAPRPTGTRATPPSPTVPSPPAGDDL